MASSDTVVQGAVAVDTWTSFVKAALGALGFALLAVGPVVPAYDAFPALPLYAFVLGGVLVLVAATMRLRSMLIVLGCIGLTAGLACTLVGNGDPMANRSALALYCAAAVTFGAVGRRVWMAIPFLLIPLLIVAPVSTDWSHSREDFAQAWTAALGCDCLWVGLPAGLAIVGAAIGEARINPWPPVRPSAFPLIITSAGLLMAGLVLASLLPDSMGFARTVCLRMSLLAGVLGWIAVAYQAGRRNFVWEAALACLLVLGGGLFADTDTRFPDSFDVAFLVTVLASLVPAVLASLGLLVRRWIGKERPMTITPTTLRKAHPSHESDLVLAASTAPMAEPKQPMVLPPSPPEPDPEPSSEPEPPKGP